MKATLIISLLFLMLSFLSACNGSTYNDQKIVTVKVTISNQLSYAPIFIAEAEGFFTEYGIKVEYITFNKGSESVALFLSGDVDVYAGTVFAGILNAYMDKNIKAVADRGHYAPGECTSLALLIRKDLYESRKITEPADLEGLTFSSQIAGPSAYLLSTYLSQGDLTFEDIEIVDLDTQAEIDAYANKALDGGTATEPDLSLFLDSGKVVIQERAEDVIGTFQSGIIAFNKKLLVDNPDIGARFLAAYLKGVHQYNEGKTERNLQILADATGKTVENLQAMCWVAIRNDGMVDFPSVDKFQRWSIAHDQLDNPVTEEQFWDPKPLNAAQALLNP